MMTTVTDFVSELFRAANEVHHLTPLAARRLLEQAVAVIRDIRKVKGKEANSAVQDATIALLKVAVSAPERSEREIRSALLDAADIIRLLNSERCAQRDSGRGVRADRCSDKPNDFA
ncbi:hypothetical protein [Ensifer sp. BR816]|uniref:hypothetical protein n=1 Tax=Rhizobium sp. (strain BR816) TaxID=1057002 RepID=UPI000374CBEE|nr:hypothetical protein [Ensifer sp. BR816]